VSDDELNRVAVIGMAGRFPGAPDVESFWAALAQGREGISHLSDDELAEAGVSRDLLRRPDYVKAKGVLDGADRFDAGFFGYSPREAEIMDPQHRVFLECAWEALESAGHDPRTFEGRIGVFAGSSLNSYLIFNVMANRRAFDSAGSYQTLIASDKDFLATRAAYKLDLKGPAVTVQTACSTSLTAVHLACQSLLGGECDIALAGGVSVSVPLKSGYVHEQGGILSADGHCRAFDADAGGTVAGNGVGVVVLRRLADARTGGDTVDAVIRGTAINNDGSLKAGYTAPSVDGQAEVIAEALAVADVDAATIGYVEAHGTGTVLGDPIEIAALTRAYREHTQDKGYCAIGSVKSGVGHLDAAAGVTALIKTVLALKHQAIPASLHHTRANPELALDASPFFVNTELRPWPRQDTPRRAGVSSFGIGGSNAHVVLEEAPEEETTPAGATSRGPHLLTLSARTAPALGDAARRLADHLDSHPGLDIGDVARTLTRRRPFEHRRTVVCHDREEAVAALRAAAGPGTEAARETPVAFLFPGQGAQYVSMARDLYPHEPVFAAELDRCADLFTPHLGEDLRTLLFAPPGDDAATGRLEQTEITQPALFAVEYALAQLWCSWGVRPRAMAGHSVGEFTAACLAGVFSLEDATALVAARGRLVQAMPRGAMLGVFLPEDETAGWLGGELCVAAVNSTGLTVVSGPTEAVDDLERRLRAAAVAHRRLHTSHAFHSPSMDAAVAPFVEEVRAVTLNPPRIPFCSDVTGTWITDEQATDPAYWGAHLRQPVRFRDALDVLLADPTLALLEVGPGHTLANFARGHRSWDDRRTLTGSLRHPGEQRDDREHLLESLGTLWRAGVPVDWAAHHGDGPHRPVRLPGYPFQRQRYWIDPDDGAGRPAPTRAAAADDWFHTPGWQRLPLQDAPAPGAVSAWVVLGADLGLGHELASLLEDEGATVVRVTAADDLRRDGDMTWSLDPTRRDHHAELLKAADALGTGPLRVVHLWSLAAGPGALDGARVDAARRTGFDSLLALAQGIGDARPANPVAVDVLCRGIHDVTGEETLQPENATLLGAATVIPQEVTDTTCRTLDVTGTDPHRPGPAALRAVRAGLGTPGHDLALRGRHWWTRHFDTVRPADGGPTRLRDGGVYLVTGGLGGVGLALAEHLAGATEQPALGLLTRSEFPAEDTWTRWLETHDEHDPTSARIHRLRRLQRLGARVAVLRADVTDADQTARAVAELRERFGALNGVVHAAGLPSRGLIAGKTAEDAGEVLAAKTHGTLVLDQVCGDDLDFVLLCSSLTSLLGGPGQSDYCAANAFLDVWAQWKRATTGLPVTAVAWDTWRGVGMAAGLASRLGGDPAGTPTGHPLLRLAQSTDEARTYVATFSTAGSWIVADHRIMGHGLVPGTTYLELVRAAVAEQAAGREIELHDVLFTLPVIVPEGQSRDVYTTIDLREGSTRFTVRSRASSGAWQEHASGSVTFHEPQEEPARDLDELLRRCEATETIESEDEVKRRFKLDLVEKGGRIEFAFGPRWRCLRRIHVGGGHRLLVTLRLDDEFLPDLDGYALHPALLDVAGASARVHAKDVYYLPFTYRSLRVRAGLTGTVHCYVELKEDQDLAGGDLSGETLTCDIEMLDPDGRPLVRITDFTIKRINDVEGMVEQVERAAAEGAPGDDEGPAGTLHTLAEGMSEQEAVAAFARLLTAPCLPEQVVVSGRDLTALRDLARSITPALLAREAEHIAPLAGSHPRPDLPTPYVAPATDDEKAVAAIWQEVLGVEEVGVDDDFFALGGHSLAAVQIGAKVRSRFGAELDLRDFFNGPTVANTVAVLARAGNGGDRAEDAIEALGRDEPDDTLAALDDLSDEEVEAQLRELLAAEANEQGENR
jgi:phthiocerol/phenolphthiocerol synthesis type-I polyketide synthase E